MGSLPWGRNVAESQPGLLGRAWSTLKGLCNFAGRVVTGVGAWRGRYTDPSLKLSYFDDVLAVELYAINERRRSRPDAQNHPHGREPIEKLKVSDAQYPGGDHARPTSRPLPEPTVTPKMDVDPAHLVANRARPRPIPCTAIGIALSGGGIRSAAFCLGALQALDFHHVVLHTDYISTVSGGGYIGASVTAAMSKGGGEFPFGTSDIRDNDAIGHLRNYSNYLLPRARSQARNLLEVAAVLLRGLIANGILVFTYLLAAALVTFSAYPKWEDLPSGNFLPKVIPAVLSLLKSLLLWAVGMILPPATQSFIDAWITRIVARLVSFPLWSGPKEYVVSLSAQLPASLHPFAFTLALAIIIAVILVIWAIVRSMWGNTANDVDSGYLTFARWWLGIATLSAFLDLQPLLVNELGENWRVIIQWHLTGLAAGPAALAAAVAVFARRLGGFLEATQLSASALVKTLRILTQIVLVAGGLVLPFIMLIAYWYLTACLYPGDKVPLFFGDAASTLRLDEHMFVAFAAIVLLFEANAYSLHQSYKDRLGKAFLFDPRRTPSGTDEPMALLNFKLSSIDTCCSPYHIINAALNVQGSKEANRRGRNADFFTFTRDFVGSDLTHFAVTQDNKLTAGIEAVDPRLDLGSAMAISGAAISANMGSNTVRWLSPTLALLNIRLGYWLRNPRDLAMGRSFLKPLEAYYRFLGKFYLFLEMFNVLDENRAFVYLTDGGHIENLGIYQLLKRGCRLIVAVDAEADPEIGCASLLKLERYARIDLGVRIILPWEQIRDRNRETSDAISPKTPGEAKRRRGPHCALGRILYEDGSYGILLYFKSSLSGDEKDYLLDYKKRYPDFPHENTGDQFFTEEQFEAYRALGYHVVEGYFSDSDEVSFLMDGHRAWPDIHAAKTEVRRALDWI